MPEASTARRWNTHVLRWVLAWWVLIMLQAPTTRGIVDFLRPRGWLTASVAVGFAVAALTIAWAVRLLVVRNRWTARQAALVVAGSVAAAIAAHELMPRVEERWHVVQYGILGALLWASVRGTRLHRMGFSLVLVTLAGWLEEVFQHFLPERVYDIWDVHLNATSGLVGILIMEAAYVFGDTKGGHSKTEVTP